MEILYLLFYQCLSIQPNKYIYSALMAEYWQLNIQNI